MSDFNTVVGNWMVNINRVNEFELDVECVKDLTGRVIKLRVYTDGGTANSYGYRQRVRGYVGFHRFPVVAEVALEQTGIDTMVVGYGRGR